MTLEEQIRATWGGDWDAQGVDRAQELADLLRKAGITSLGEIGVNKTTRDLGYGGGASQDYSPPAENPQDAYQWTMGGQTLGYLGDYNADNTYGNQADPHAQAGVNPLVGWSSRGHGNVGYSLIKNPATGQYEIRPDWGSSSDAGMAGGIAKGAALVGGTALGLNTIGGMLGGGAAAAGTAGGAASGGLSSADLAAIYGPEGYGAGTAGTAGGLGAASGGLGGAWNGTDFSGAAGSAAGSAASAGGGAWNGMNFGGGGVDWLSALMSNAPQLLGNFLQYEASRRASGDLQNAANKASQTQWDMFNKATELNEPWRQAGIGALGQLNTGTAPGGDFNRSFTMADFQQDPGYAFRLAQGQKALEASAAARGGLLSGGTGKALVDYGQASGSQEYGNAYNRWNNDMSLRYNRLSNLAGLGQTATASDVNTGQTTAGRVGDYQTQAGNASAAGTIGGANAINSGLTTLGNWWATQPGGVQPSGQKWWGGSPSPSWGTPGMNQFFYGQGTTGD